MGRPFVSSFVFMTTSSKKPADGALSGGASITKGSAIAALPRRTRCPLTTGAGGRREYPSDSRHLLGLGVGGGENPRINGAESVPE